MKKRTQKIILLLIALLSASPLMAQSVLKVMSLNAKSGEIATRDMFVRTIRAERPDIIAFQEIDYFTDRAGNFVKKDMIMELADELGMFPYFGKAINYRNGEYGNAILSRYPIIECGNLLLPTPTGSKEQRVYTWGMIQLPSGKKFVAGSIHLDNSTTAIRVQQINALKEFAASKQEVPVMVCGDFNVGVDGEEIVTGMATFDRHCNDAPTWKSLSSSSTAKLDYLFSFPKGAVSGSEYRIVNGASLSDHYPIVVKITLNK